MANNTIRIEFQACEPTPVNGYQVSYRPLGSSIALRVWPVNFITSPAEFTDTNDPEGTSYEGNIRSDCAGGLLGEPIPWEAINPDAPSGSASASASESPGEGPNDVIILNLGGGVPVIEDVFGIAGFTMPGPLSGGSVQGKHTAFTGVISVELSGSPISGSLSLRRNGILLECINIGFPGTYGFASQTFATDDIIEVRWFGGAC